MSVIPTIHSWNLSNYARRIQANSVLKNEYSWSCLDSQQTTLKLIITPTLQLMVVSGEQCIEELIDIWLMFNCTYLHVHCKSILFVYKWPSNLTRFFRIQLSNDKDLSQCLKILGDYFPIHIYSSDDVNHRMNSTQPTMFRSTFLNETKNILASEQTVPTNIRTDFIRQYLSTCIMDPAFLMFTNRYEQILKNMLEDK